jgi:hypothetical protein
MVSNLLLKRVSNSAVVPLPSFVQCLFWDSGCSFDVFVIYA